MRKRRSKKFVKIYQDLEQIFARKGKKSLWPNKPFKHKFEKGAEVIGVNKSGSVKLRKGDLIVRSRYGKPLWRYFDYK